MWESGDRPGGLEDPVGFRSSRYSGSEEGLGNPFPTVVVYGGDVPVQAELCSADGEAKKPRNCSRVVFALQKPSIEDRSSREGCSGTLHVRPSR